MVETQKYRIGIDVGGTFTHAVAVDVETLDVAGRSKVPTTHTAEEGVARGVVQSLQSLLEKNRINPDQIVLIAHSTTQATNALLEGDVAPVGIIGMGDGIGAVPARRQTALKSIPLAPERDLKIVHRFLKTSEATEEKIEATIRELQKDGAQTIVASEAFSVDDPRREQRVCNIAEKLGIPATATHHVSQLHGLGIRTRTAVINASMIPTMLRTADMTEKAVRESGITAPLMVMRSDGGVMSIEEMRHRPILTMLSGPAAGVAAALLYARVSDGIFLEVGGTSTDISVIKDGKTQIRSGEVGGNRLYVSTLDVRTLGIAGGSTVYMENGHVSRVGPRSAHLAGVPYLSFTDNAPDALKTGSSEKEFLTVCGDNNESHAITPTCASNRLGFVPEGDPAEGKLDKINKGMDVAASSTRYADGEQLAEALLAKASEKIAAVVDSLILEYKLDKGLIRLVAGGGGGSAIVPHVAKTMGLPYHAAENADVISAIGVALALIRDTVERTIISPTDDDIRRAREDAVASVTRMGAAPDTIEVFVEVDSKRNLLRATAQGSTEIKQQELRPTGLDDKEKQNLVQTSIGESIDTPRTCAAGAGFEVWTATKRIPRLWKFLHEDCSAVRILDDTGTLRWASNKASAKESRVANAVNDLEAFAETFTRYSDAGATIPKCYVLLGNRIVDLSGLVDMPQVLNLLQVELQAHPANRECILVLDHS